MKKTLLSTLILATLGMASAVASAQENPWMVRVRAVNVNWENGGQANSTNGVWADNKVIPEVDISYFFTKNIAAELVLTYPQKVDIYLGSSNIGHVNALPPSLLLQYHFTNFGAFKPYIGAGVNYTMFSSRKNLGSGTYSIESSSTGLVGQLGADYMLDKNWGVNFDVKYIKMNTDVFTNNNGASIGNLNLSPVAASVGVTYKF